MVGRARAKTPGKLFGGAPVGSARPPAKWRQADFNFKCAREPARPRLIEPTRIGNHVAGPRTSSLPIRHSVRGARPRPLVGVLLVWCAGLAQLAQCVRVPGADQPDEPAGSLVIRTHQGQLFEGVRLGPGGQWRAPVWQTSDNNYPRAGEPAREVVAFLGKWIQPRQARSHLVACHTGPQLTI